MKIISTLFCIMVIIVPAYSASIIQISIPENSQFATSHPASDNVWSVNAFNSALDVTSGIGNLINPTFSPSAPSTDATDFALHDNNTYSNHTPVASQHTVTFQFDTQVVVDQMEIVQHVNGIAQIEGFVGNSLNSMTSIGIASSPGALSEYGAQIFDCNNTAAGTFFQFVVHRSTHPNAYAIYRAFPRDTSGLRFSAATTAVPEPSTNILLALSLVSICFILRKKS